MVHEPNQSIMSPPRIVAKQPQPGSRPPRIHPCRKPNHGKGHSDLVAQNVWSYSKLLTHEDVRLESKGRVHNVSALQDNLVSIKPAPPGKTRSRIFTSYVCKSFALEPSAGAQLGNKCGLVASPRETSGNSYARA
jgi:hypothetical protein